jgi:hypothetical protein
MAHTEEELYKYITNKELLANIYDVYAINKYITKLTHWYNKLPTYKSKLKEEIDFLSHHITETEKLDVLVSSVKYVLNKIFSNSVLPIYAFEESYILPFYNGVVKAYSVSNYKIVSIECMYAEYINYATDHSYFREIIRNWAVLPLKITITHLREETNKYINNKLIALIYERPHVVNYIVELNIIQPKLHILKFENWDLL